jgi:oligoendopeptidase F
MSINKLEQMNITITSWDDVKFYYEELLERKINSVQELKDFISDRANGDNYLSQDFAWRYIKQSCDTTNEELKKHYESFIDKVQAERSKIWDLLNKKIVESEFADQLDGAYYIFMRSVKRAIELFNEKNIPLQQEIEKLTSQYGEVVSKMTIEHNGEELTFKQAEKYLKDKDRGVRKEVREKVSVRREQDSKFLDELLDKLIDLRNQVALNSGFPNYVEYAHYANNIFDYTIDDINNFHTAIKNIVTPLCQSLQRHRKEKLRNELKPYDFNVSLYSKTSHDCYKDSEDLVQKVSATLNATHPGFGDLVLRMKDLKQLDLDTRKGKRAGGYNYPLAMGDTSFIFMNAATDSYGVFTMLHECGHALHHHYTYGIEPSYQRHPGSEVCEIASMAQELLSLDKLDNFFANKSDYNIAILEKLEDDLLIFPRISKIDLFQQRLYTNIGHTHEQRHQKRIQLTQEYPQDSSIGIYDAWTEEYMNYLWINWQKQIHIFDYPFYYIEYGIAWLAAIAMWKNYLTDKEQGIKNYINLLKTGDTKTMPEIFQEGGIKFDFSSQYIQWLMDFMQERIDKTYESLDMIK